MSYHIKKIERGTYGNFSKIKEEFLELEDAVEQGNKLLALCEMADIIGAIEGYLETHAHGITLNDILAMKNATKRAFKSGARTDKAEPAQQAQVSPWAYLPIQVDASDLRRVDISDYQKDMLTPARDTLRESILRNAAKDALMFLEIIGPFLGIAPRVAEDEETKKITLFWDIPGFYADVEFVGNEHFSLFTRNHHTNADASLNDISLTQTHIGDWFKKEIQPLLKPGTV